MMLGIGVLIVGFFVGPAAYPYACQTNLFPAIATIGGFASGIFFGFVLGVFYDAFGRLHEEEKNDDGNAPPSLPETTFGP